MNQGAWLMISRTIHGKVWRGTALRYDGDYCIHIIPMRTGSVSFLCTQLNVFSSTGTNWCCNSLHHCAEKPSVLRVFLWASKLTVILLVLFQIWIYYFVNLWPQKRINLVVIILHPHRYIQMSTHEIHAQIFCVYLHHLFLFLNLICSHLPGF